jgi:hypothetical protein
VSRTIIEHNHRDASGDVVFRLIGDNAPGARLGHDALADLEALLRHLGWVSVPRELLAFAIADCVFGSDAVLKCRWCRAPHRGCRGPHVRTVSRPGHCGGRVGPVALEEVS